MEALPNAQRATALEKTENVFGNKIEQCPLFGREAIVGKVHFRSRPKCRGRNLSGYCGCIAAANTSAFLVYKK
jgi:hypothetical protein